MRHSLWAVLGLLLLQEPVYNGQPVQVNPCLAVHQDAAVNTAVTLVVPAPSRSDLFVYICGWDWQVTANSTGTAQANVKWTTTNLSGVLAEYSTAATAYVTISGNFTYPSPVKAQANNSAVTFISPAAATNNAYSVNAYYRYGY